MPKHLETTDRDSGWHAARWWVAFRMLPQVPEDLWLVLPTEMTYFDWSQTIYIHNTLVLLIRVVFPL